MTKPLKLDDLAREAREADACHAKCNFGLPPWDGSGHKDKWRAIAQGILTTIKESGYAIVPVEPTNKMLLEGWLETPERWTGCEDDLLPAWEEMIVAAPKIEDVK